MPKASFFAALAGLFCAACTFGQTPYFQYIYASTPGDFGFSAATTQSGRYLLGGQVHPGAATLIQTDAFGKIYWQRYYFEPHTSWIESIAEAADGGYWLLTNADQPHPAADDYMLLRTDSAGEILWARRWPNMSVNSHRTNLLAVPGGCIFSSFSVDNAVNGTMLRIDDDGALRWHKQYNFEVRAGLLLGDTLFASGRQSTAGCLARINPNTGIPYSVLRIDGALNEEALYYMALAGDGDLLLTDHAYGSIQDLDLWAVRISRNGVLRWSNRYGADSTWIQTEGCRAAPNGGFLIAGNLGADPMTMKIDDQGNQVWAKHYGNSFSERIWEAVAAPGGGLLCVGQTEAPGDSTGINLLLLRMDTLGNTGPCTPRQFNAGTSVYPATLSALPFTATDLDAPVDQHAESSLINTLEVMPFCGNPPVYAQREIDLCPGDSIGINGHNYGAPAIVTDTLAAASGSDSVVTYTLKPLSYYYAAANILLPPGATAVIGGDTLTAPALVLDTLASTTGGCDTVLRYLLQLDTLSGGLPGSTFLKKYGEPGVSEAGYVLCPAGDGNLYVSGLKDKRTFIMKVNPDGAVLWERSFVVNPFEPVIPSDLMTDSEGMLVGCGTTGIVQGLHKGFVFRYDPQADKLLWTQTIVSNRPSSAGLLEKSPGGNFLYVQNPQPAFNQEGEWLEINRSTGAIVPALAKRYRYKNDLKINAAEMHQGALYSVGYSLGRENNLDSNSVRHLLMKTDLNTGAVEWANLSYTDTTDFSVMQNGHDLLIESDTLVSVGGLSKRAMNGAAWLDGSIYLQKNALNGDIYWARQYLNAGDPDALIPFAGGYVISGSLGTNSQFILRVDRDGFPLWARRLELNFSSFTYFGDNAFQDNLVALDGYLYLVMPTDPQEKHDVILLKMDANGNIAGACDFLKPMQVTMQTVFAPLNTAISPDVAGSPAVATASIVPVLPGNLPVTGLCPLICSDTLDLGADQLRCAGDTLMLHAGAGFVAYLWQDGSTGASLTAWMPGIYWVQVTDTCGVVQRDSVTLTFRPLETLSDTLYFCPGDTVTFDGLAYTLPGIVLDTLPGTAGNCDTLVTTYLRYLTDGQVAALTLDCPPNLTVTAPSGAGAVKVNFDPPAPLSDCFCPGITLTQTAGLPPGGAFPTGVNTVCFEAQDHCGSTANCCFEIKVVNVPAPADACDVKVNGCARFELLRITRDPLLRKTYHFRISNQCQQEMDAVAFQIPDGLTALTPATNTTYTAPGGHIFTVRNPNFSPFYSIRFSAQGAGVGPGQSAEFQYTLPPQADPTFIHALVRLEGQGFIETHLNVFDCPVENTPSKPAAERGQGAVDRPVSPALAVFPNPSAGSLSVRLIAFDVESVEYRILNLQGQVCHSGYWHTADGVQVITLPASLPDGVYWLECRGASGNLAGGRFVLGK